MNKLTLIETNQYLKDSKLRSKLNERSARSSCGVEGIVKDDSVVTPKIVRRKKPLFDRLKSKLSADSR